jgi:hypothetical protein
VPLTRAAAATQITAALAELFGALAVVPADVSGGMKEPLDAALRTLGVAEADLAAATVADADVPGYLALATWHALRRLRRAASVVSGASLAAGGTNVRFADLNARIAELIADVEGDLAAAGLLGNSWQDTAAWPFDFLEPSRAGSW